MPIIVAQAFLSKIFLSVWSIKSRNTGDTNSVINYELSLAVWLCLEDSPEHHEKAESRDSNSFRGGSPSLRLVELTIPTMNRAGNNDGLCHVIHDKMEVGRGWAAKMRAACSWKQTGAALSQAPSLNVANQ